MNNLIHKFLNRFSTTLRSDQFQYFENDGYDLKVITFPGDIFAICWWVDKDGNL